MKKLCLKRSHVMSVTDGGTQYTSALATGGKKKKNLPSVCAFAVVTIIRHKCPEIKLFITRPHTSIR